MLHASTNSSDKSTNAQSRLFLFNLPLLFVSKCHVLVKIIFPFNIYLYGRYLAYMLNIPLNTYKKRYKIIIIY